MIYLAGLPTADFEAAAAAGADTRDYYATRDGTSVHCRDARDAHRCLDGLIERGGKPAVLWLGNSQLHAVNQLVPGERGAASVLQASLADDERDLIVFSQPNANLQEHYVLFEALAEALTVTRSGVVPDSTPGATAGEQVKPLPFETLLLPLVFDDLRESGLRDGIVELLAEPVTARALERTAIGRTLLERYAALATPVADNPSGRWQRDSEAWLESRLSASGDLWARRGEYRSRFLFGLYAARNRALGITASSTRRLIPVRYAENMAALAALVASASRRGLDVRVYIAPIRDDVPLPYDEAEYAAFIADARALAEQNDAKFADLGSLVDARHWGLTGLRGLDGKTSAEIDFMHFRASGHAVLADALADWLAVR